MNDLEYISTICAFVAGIMILVQLFLMRHRIKKLARIRMIQAKAKIHNMTRLTPYENNAWREAQSDRRNFK